MMEKPMENPWKTTKNHGKPWKNDGHMMEKLGEHLEKKRTSDENWEI